MSSDPTHLGDDPQASLEGILAESCRDLFAAYGIDISSGAGADTPQPLLGRIHFVGRDLSGNLTIGLDREQIKYSLPIKTDRQADLEDWVRELANQLMGLVKTRLQEQGINVILSLPATVKPSTPPDGPTSSSSDVAPGSATHLGSDSIRKGRAGGAAPSSAIVPVITPGPSAVSVGVTCVAGAWPADS